MTQNLTDAPLPVAPSSTDAEALLLMIAAAARDEKVDVDKMRELLSMRERIMRFEAESAFNRDMLQAQESMRPIVRDAVNRQQGSRYALLESIDRQVRPVYTSHGFCMSFNTGTPRDPGSVRMLCEVRHIAGHVATYELEGALDATGDRGNQNKSSIKALGSTNSYLRRYLTMMIWNLQLTNEDDDGAGDGNSPLTPFQISNVVEMLRICNITGERLAKFLQFADAKKVEDIRQYRYADIMTKLRSVERQTKEGPKG